MPMLTFKNCEKQGPAQIVGFFHVLSLELPRRNYTWPSHLMHMHSRLTNYAWPGACKANWAITISEELL